MIIPALFPLSTNGRLARRGTDSVLEDFLRGFDLEPLAESEKRLSTFAPKLSLAEDESKITVTAEMPGMAQEDVDISLKGGYLTIRGHKKEEKEECEKGNCRYSERSYGEFERVITLHSEIDTDRVDASMKNGVLTLVLPKVIEEKDKEKKISIRKS